MVASTATYAARRTDDAAYLKTQLLDGDGVGLDLTTLGYATAVYFVAEHKTDTDAPKIRVAGVFDIAGEGRVHVVLDVAGSSPLWAKGLYDSHWDVENAGGDAWALPAAGGETFQILESLQ